MKEINKQIQELQDSGGDTSSISDGFHTFKELYEFRKMYNAVLFNIWGSNKSINKNGDVVGEYDVHKSWKHNDGEWCFGKKEEWFIVVAMLPTGQITNHYTKENWDLFQIPEVKKAKYKFDGHTGKDVLERLKDLI